jgi:hypothetical protein
MIGGCFKRTLDFSKITSALVFCLFLSVLTSPSVRASEYDDCGFGQTLDFDENYNEICVPSRWILDGSNDSFDRVLFSNLMADSTDSPDVSEISIELNCRNSKHFNIFIWGDEDLYAWTNNRGIGTALMTFDNGKIQKFTYKRTYDSSQIYFTQPKQVAKFIYKAKRKFNLKFYTYSGSTVAYFPVVDIFDTALRLKIAGCPLV